MFGFRNMGGVYFFAPIRLRRISVLSTSSAYFVGLKSNYVHMNVTGPSIIDIDELVHSGASGAWCEGLTPMTLRTQIASALFVWFQC